MRARAVLVYIDFVELWASRFAYGSFLDLREYCQQALGLVGLRAQLRDGEVIGLRQVRRGVWAREPERWEFEEVPRA